MDGAARRPARLARPVAGTVPCSLLGRLGALLYQTRSPGAVARNRRGRDQRGAANGEREGRAAGDTGIRVAMDYSESATTALDCTIDNLLHHGTLSSPFTSCTKAGRRPSTRSSWLQLRRGGDHAAGAALGRTVRRRGPSADGGEVRQGPAVHETRNRANEKERKIEPVSL